MIRISTEEIERDWRGYLEKVEAGETLVITRAGTPVAEIKPVTQDQPVKPEWLPETAAALQELLCLPQNWNSYGALPISSELVQTAVELLREMANPDAPPPIVVPTVRGGVQLEWHTRGVDLEIEIASPERFLVYYADASDDTDCELELSPAQLPRLAELTAQLSRPVEASSGSDGTGSDEP